MAKEEHTKRFVSEEDVPPNLRKIIEKADTKALYNNKLNNLSPVERFYTMFVNYRYGLDGVTADGRRAKDSLNQYVSACVDAGEQKEDVYFRVFCDFIDGNNRLQKNERDAFALLQYIKDSYLMDVQLRILSFLGRMNSINADEEISYSHYRIYKIYKRQLDGAGSSSDEQTISEALGHIKIYLKRHNNLSIRDELRELYGYSYTPASDKTLNDYCYMRAIEEKIPEAMHDYANYLRSINNNLKASFWYAKCKDFKAAYNCVNIFDLENVNTVIEYIKNEVNDSSICESVLVSLSRIRDNHAAVCRLKSMAEYSSTKKIGKKFRTILLLYLFVGFLWSFFRSYQKSTFSLIAGIALLVITGLFMQTVGMIPFVLYVTAMFIWDAYDRARYIKSCRLLGSLYEHPQLKEIKNLPAYAQYDKVAKDSVSVGAAALFVVFIIGLCGVFPLMAAQHQNNTQTNSTTTNVDKDVDKNNDTTPAKKENSQKENSNNKDVKTNNESSAKIKEIVKQKDNLDLEIASVASDVNNYLTNHKNFRGKDANGILNKAKAVKEKVEKAQADLNAIKVEQNDERIKQSLSIILDAEADRIRGLYKGMLDSRNNGDYANGFKQGAVASDKFNAENDKFNSLYK